MFIYGLCELWLFVTVLFAFFNVLERDFFISQLFKKGEV